jgi:hypothetical protein
MTQRKIAHDVRIGRLAGIPEEFVPLIIAFPDRVYGKWWLAEEPYYRDALGWYIWIESANLLDVSRHKKVAWHVGGDFESALTILANRLLVNHLVLAHQQRRKSDERRGGCQHNSQHDY